MKWMGPVVCRGERINAYNILVQKICREDAIWQTWT